ncbi:hypothetical protein Esi_0030_0017 [Ectocarpus siliculosus]|uniref:PP2A regulatory subunit B'' EF-hand domain-containing protein n=1 Tax=Ectocarpus siliculosus TaxID=2880 RepID=D8LKE9_ECTSI|nr:hypothetical protein Esi_0030_0017 [Ectocarpus siliculosus]|eukprot:CBN74539.1 hypothetical protein Esi_0030_0017 [Ectocarpus siliculosus]
MALSLTMNSISPEQDWTSTGPHRKDKAPALARHTKTEEGGGADETEPVDSALQAATVGGEDLRKLLFAKVEEELARRQAVAAKAAAAKAVTAVTEAAAEAAATPVQEMAAATAVPAMAVPATAMVTDESQHMLPGLYVPSPPIPPLEYSYRPILDRTAKFAVHCGFCSAVAPLLLDHIVSTVYGAQFAGSVAMLTTADVDYMFHVFWNYVVTTYTREEIFFRMVTRPGNSGIMRDNLRPLIAVSVQYHQDFIVLSPLNKVLFVENVLTDIFFRNGRCGVIGLQDLCRSDLVASLSAVGRHEIVFSDSAYLSWHIDGAKMIPGESSPVFNGAFTSGHWDYPPAASIYAF